ncbi:rhomboid family intramembrane serine protease [Arenimonas sp. MALMAid1274]|uniref:rhomboid family intramembrane serine protease n=1 Tax=Arenimonas sp. MALMAid1274 TaxID=3411630 RepID=UPI003BA349E0
MQFPPLTKKLLWVLAAMLLLPLVLPRSLAPHLMLWPLGDDGSAMASQYGFAPWQVLTHVVLDTAPMHLIFIALTVVFFGSQLEMMWGERRYGLYLLTCAAGGGVFQLLVMSIGLRYGVIPYLPSAGASAVAFGILFACAYLNPHQRVMLLIPPIPMKMWVLVAVICGMELAFGVFASDNGLAHLGFLGGMLAGWLHIRYWRGLPPFRPRRPPGPRLVR